MANRLQCKQRKIRTKREKIKISKNKKKKASEAAISRSKTEVIESPKEQDLKIPETSRQKDLLKVAAEPSCEQGWTAVPETIKKKKSRKKKTQLNKPKIDPSISKKTQKGQNSLNTSSKNNSVKKKASQVTQKKEPKAKSEKRKKPQKTMVDRISKSIILQIVNQSVDLCLEQIKAKKDAGQIEKKELPKPKEISKIIQDRCKEEKEIKLITENEDMESCSLSVVPNQKAYQSTLNSERNSPSASTCIKLKKEDISLASHCKEDNFDQISRPYIEESKEKRSDNLVITSEEHKQTSKSIQDECQKPLSIIHKIETFKPTYAKKTPHQSSPYNVHGQSTQNSWQFQQNYNMGSQTNNGFTQLLDNSCLQLLHEKLMAFATTGYQGYNQVSGGYYGHHIYQGSDARSHGIPSGVNFPNDTSPGYQEGSTYNGSNTEYQSTVHDEAGFFERVDKEIYKFVEEVKRKLDSVQKEREICAQKIILDMCKEAFEGQKIQIDVFGSLSTGLALESSDMDLVIIGLKIENRGDIVDHIRILAQYFEESEYFRNINPIEGASIPVIKLEVDLQLIRENENSENKSEVGPNMRYLQIDITFEDHKRIQFDTFWEGDEWDHSKLNHLGIKSIHLVKSYLKDYSHISELTLCVKKLLSLRGLNSPYKGGLSSYGVTIMIVAYMNFFSLQNSWLHVSQLLIHLLEFYGSKFDERKVGILVNRGGCFYPFNSVSEHPIVIKDPLNIENNIGKSTYRFSEIKSAFSESASILQREKNSYYKISEEEILEQDHLLQEDTPEFIEKLFYLRKIFTSEGGD
ncbi:unnamed protein product [Moneuplotes crassus]|uniref:Polymerase nucleotidyl transferase domain-containing protein n=1 Tax=Euplotes crassus TaxID=5936 RepID=A0AAD2D367_EUPCR|nr:unnamed protein product [Moneuplotes crassus]